MPLCVRIPEVVASQPSYGNVIPESRKGGNIITPVLEGWIAAAQGAKKPKKVRLRCYTAAVSCCKLSPHWLNLADVLCTLQT